MGVSKSIHLTTAHDVASTDKCPIFWTFAYFRTTGITLALERVLGARAVSVSSSSGVRAVFTSGQRFLRTPIPFLILEGICEFERGFLQHVR
jgi:hypothetical protein